MLNELLDRHQCKHYFLGDVRPKDGAVICWHGGNTPRQAAAQINRWAEDQPWVVYISIGDEWGDWAYKNLERGPNTILWVQTPKPGVTSADRYLIEGYPHDCPSLLKEAGEVERNYDWAFMGQINHSRRDQLSSVLSKYNDGPHFLMETKSFGAGLPHDMYYSILKQSKVVPCPAGLATPDSFRFAEALEAGAVPVLDAFAPDGVRGYWDMVLGRDHPFFLVDDWHEFPGIVRLITKRFDAIQSNTQSWWERYKRNFSYWLTHDLADLTSDIEGVHP